MINISTETHQPGAIVDEIARLAVPSTIGISTGPYGTIVHLPDGANSADQSKAQAVIDNYDALTVSADKTSMNEGDADPVISCSDPSIASDANIGYVVLLDGEVYASGTDSVSSGTAQLTLVAPVAGVYDIFMYRLSGNYASGSVRIVVSEV